MKIPAVLVAALLLFCGCATDPGAKISKYQIKTVGVEPRVNASPLRYGEIHPGTANAGLAGLIVDATKSKQMKRMAALMQEQHIDVPSMVRSNFIQAVSQIGYEYSENHPEATFVLELDQHGFDQRSAFSSMKAPFAVLRGKLVTSDGKVIWRGNSQNGKGALLGPAANSFERGRKDIGVADWADYEKDPEKLRQDWDAAVRNAIYELLRAAKNAK